MAASAISQEQCIEWLTECYGEVTRKKGLRDFTVQIRGEKNDLSGKYSLKRQQLSQLFSDQVWQEIKTKSGHRKIRNVVTHIVINYPDHGPQTVDPGVAESILEAVQKHLNILHDTIFKCSGYGWEDKLDYPAAAQNWFTRNEGELNG